MVGQSSSFVLFSSYHSYCTVLICAIFRSASHKFVEVKSCDVNSSAVSSSVSVSFDSDVPAAASFDDFFIFILNKWRSSGLCCITFRIFTRKRAPFISINCVPYSIIISRKTTLILRRLSRFPHLLNVKKVWKGGEGRNNMCNNVLYADMAKHSETLLL